MPFFSIIIPTYNRAHIIHRPVKSILAQTFTDWELIVVDDGSTDNTQEIVMSYNDPRIRYVWQENQERSAARNHGIRLAQGEWICFQDSDDEYLAEHLEVLYEGIKSNPAYKVIRTGLRIITSEGKEKYSPVAKEHKYDTYPVQCFTSAAFEKSVFRDCKFDNYLHIGEDAHFFFRVYESFDILVIPGFTVIYYSENTSRINLGYQLEKLKSFEKLRNLNLSKSKAAVNFQISFISQSILYHSVAERKQVIHSLQKNFREFFTHPDIYLYSLWYYLRIRILG
ncbi:MAG: glycosyltransferase family 2 protein [Saprospiraceae bacterium]|nr:glycosyltransferase family 2 protein [Saprospiraceae bacterium]